MLEGVRGRGATADAIISEELLGSTRVIQMSDQAYDSLPIDVRLFAESTVLDLVDRFRKLVRLSHYVWEYKLTPPEVCVGSGIFF